MRQQLLIVAVVCMALATAQPVRAQSSNTSATSQNPSMPGTVVSNTGAANVRMIGKDQPQVGKQVGKPINIPSGNSLMRPYNPNNPYESLQGTNLNPSSVIAPVNGYTSNAQPGVFGQVVDMLKSVAGISTKPSIQQSNFTPGIFRRDRQRAEERMWTRD